METQIENGSGAVNMGWMDTIKQSLANYRVWLPEVALYGGVAFLTGFLLKNFGRYIVAAVVIALLTIVALQYAGIVSQSMAQIFEMIGLPGIASFQEGVDLFVAWVQNHVLGVLSIIIGFALGWSIG